MTKPTFASVLAKTQEDHLKSDLENLAHAHTLVASHISYLQALQARIEAVGEDPKACGDGAVWALYDEAQKATRVGGRRA